MGPTKAARQDPEDWRALAKCNSLTLTEVDAMFFPGRGGKSKRAENFCNDCPVIRDCLRLALAPGTQGFFAGTNENTRNQMRQFEANVFPSIASVMPKEPTRRDRKLRAVGPSFPDRTLDTVEGPSVMDEIKMFG